jgi:D-alanyl-lipoteichoic acid acyltransferase DltB (MBOAT superfamily)
MIFSSIAFLVYFLPAALLGFAICSKFGRAPTLIWLSLISLIFYAVWKPIFVVVLLGSIVMNFVCSRLIAAASDPAGKKRWMVIGIVANLGALCYFKYLHALFQWLISLGAGVPDLGAVILPLGISFFTFTQIAYLVDLAQDEAEPQDIISYTLFVTFFPHLIAGPILHYGEMMPQFGAERKLRFHSRDVAIGFTWFVMGLAKKVLIADAIAPIAATAYATPTELTAVAAWTGVLAYSLQLYFDFSGYSDMALGLARMFSIRFPFNFDSPYKARNILDYWQRWHMTLTRYVALYLYNPMSLAINRRRMAAGKKVSAKAQKTLEGFLSMVVLPTVVTMFIVGVWHGAGSQFMIFGLLQGTYFCICHAWRMFGPKSKDKDAKDSPFTVMWTWVVTYVAVLVGQVFFRSASTEDALEMLQSLVGKHGIGTDAIVVRYAVAAAFIYPFLWFAPNTQEVLGETPPVHGKEAPKKAKPLRFRPAQWQPNIAWAVAMGVVLVLVMIGLQDTAAFLYFQF